MPVNLSTIVCVGVRAYTTCSDIMQPREYGLCGRTRVGLLSYIRPHIPVSAPEYRMGYVGVCALRE